MGACKRGSACNFAHDSGELKEMSGSPNLWANVGGCTRVRKNRRQVFGESPDPCVHVVDLPVILIDDVVF